jgi:DedD protein
VAKTPISNEELQLRKRARRRLVGAIVLVLLVVVLVPMFLEHEPRLQKQDMDIRIPPVPGQTQAPSFPAAPPAPATAPSPVPAEKAETPAPPAPPSESVAQSAADASTATNPGSKPPTAQAAPNPASVPQRQDESAANPASPAPSKETARQPAAGESFVIQVGAFVNASNGRQLMQQIRAHKFPAYTELVKTTQGEKTRVRVGPYPSVEVAEKARDRLKALKLVAVSDPRVVRAGE